MSNFGISSLRREWTISLAKASALFLALALLSKSVYAVDTISVAADTDGSYHPGDLIEIEILYRSKEIGQAQLHAPLHGSARLVDQQAYPLKLDSGNEYALKWVLLYQFARSGGIELDHGFIEIESSDGMRREAITPISIDVVGFGEEKDSDEPQPLPESAIENSKTPWTWGILLLALSGSAVALWRISKRNAIIESNEREDPSTLLAKQLRTAILSGDSAPIERFLSGPCEQHSSGLRQALEDAVYSKNPAIDRVIQQMEKELAR